MQAWREEAAFTVGAYTEGDDVSKLWRQIRRPRRDYTADAVSLFTRFSQRHGLNYKPLDDPTVEVMWEFPAQEKLVWPVTLGLRTSTS